MVPEVAPTEVVKISPENLEVANCYLQCSSVREVADNLDLAPSTVSEIIARPEVRAYINTVFSDIGYNSRFKMRKLMDTIITKKLQELEEADMGSAKDIVEILEISHRMTMNEEAAKLKVLQLEQKVADSKIKNQVNVQINDNSVNDGSKYSQLIQKLIESQNANN